VDPPKAENCYKGFRLATVTGEQQYIKGNTKFFAVALQGGGGPFAVVPYANKGGFLPGTPVVAGHKSAVLDFDFNPFHEHIIASASEDSTIKVWGIPPDGLTETVTEPLVDLHGHGRKVTLLRFHPTANNVLGSVSGDFAVKVWDIEKGCESSSMACHEQLIQELVWDTEGKHWATSCKDKTVRIGDPRGRTLAHELKEAHAGAKSTKIAFLGDSQRFATVGFTKQSQRQVKIWDTRDLSKMVHKVDLDQAAGVIVPYYDPDTKVLYLSGKGDGNIRYYEMSRDKPFAFALSEHRSTQAGKGTCFIPKRGLNVMGCETARCLKLVSQNGAGTVEPLSFIVPRKSDAFQEDIFPDTFSGLPSHSADEWAAGSDKAPLKMSLNPANGGGGGGGGGARPAFKTLKSSLILTKELETAEARIAVLEERLKKAGLDAS